MSHMKLTLRPEWRLRPLSTFLGFLDLKTGVTVALLFALLNKVAGVYGLIAVLTGAGGSAAQLSLYIYSLIGLIALAWGLRAVTQEDAKHTLYFAHLFFADHVLSTAWTVFFAVVWWVYTPHDGRRQTNSAAQEEMAKTGAAIAGNLGSNNMTEEERAYAAMTMWNDEKGRATMVILLGWLAKIYFALLLYSYAIHLRKGSYRSLPRTRIPQQQHNATSYGGSSALSTLPDEDEEVEDFYRLPLRTPTSAGGLSSSSHHTRTNSSNARQSHIRSSSGAGSSISSFADFVSAPGRGGRRFNNNNNNSNSNANNTRGSNLNPANSGKSVIDDDDDDDVDEVLFDEEELAGRSGTDADSTITASGSGSGSGTSGRGDSGDEDRVPLVGGGGGGGGGGGSQGSSSSRNGRRQSRARI